jgi:hypothetical protein
MNKSSVASVAYLSAICTTHAHSAAVWAEVVRKLDHPDLKGLAALLEINAQILQIVATNAAILNGTDSNGRGEARPRE